MESGIEAKVQGGAHRGRALVGTIVPRREDDSWLGLLGQISPVAIFRGDALGNCNYANERWCELSGLPIEAAMGLGWMKAVHPEDVPAVAQEWTRTCELGIPFRMEYRYRRPDGSVVWILGQAVAETDARGRAMSYIGTATDTTELHRMREAIEHSHAELEERVRERTAQFEHMALIVAASADAIISSDLAGRIVSWNRAAEKIFGYPAAEAIGRSTAFVTPAHLAAESAQLKVRLRAGETVEYLETVRLAKSGELIDVGISIFPLRDLEGNVIGTSAIVRDIREEKKTARRLSQLSGRLLRVQDEERRRLARDLHDSTAQSLAALSMHLTALDRSADMPPDQRSSVLATVRDLAKTIERELRTHTYLLHPPLLEERGLSAALRWLVEGFAARSGVAVHLSIDETLGRLPDAVELTFFRVVQESLSNIHRHAKSPTAEVRLEHLKHAIVLEVRDAGCGLPPESTGGGGVGIAGMRERLAEIGGTLSIRSGDDGTTVRASISR